MATLAARDSFRRRPLRTDNSPSTNRKRWVRLIAVAGGGQLPASDHMRVDFLHEVRRASVRAWQDDGLSAVKLAEAFLALGEGACLAADQARRDGLLVLLAGCASALDAIATARATALAQRTWARGED